jgi:hypothetical protein
MPVAPNRETMTPKDDLSRNEIRKDAIQDATEAAANTVGTVAVIVTNAVRDVAKAVGGLATDLFEIRQAGQRATEDALPPPSTAPRPADPASPDPASPEPASPDPVSPDPGSAADPNS